MGHCIVESSEVDSRFKARVCLIVINSMMEVPSDEMSSLKFLRGDMFERGVKTMLVLIGSFDRKG